MSDIILGHERLDVYKTARLLLAFSFRLTLGMRGRAAVILRDQLLRAAVSIMLNIAEGNGENHPKERAKFFAYARRSAEECAACLDGLVDVDATTQKRTNEGKAFVKRIVEMLVRMIQKADPDEHGLNRSQD